MRKTWWLLLLFLLPACKAEAPKPTEAPKAVEAPKPAETPRRVEAPPPNPIFLWEAKHETGTAYLFGTIHLPDPRVLELPRIVKQAIDRSDVILTEITLDPATQLKVQQMMLLPKGEKLSAILPAELQKRITGYLPMAALDGMKPWAAGMMLMILQARDLFLSGRQPLDTMIPILAKQRGKETGALETAEEQIGIFDQMTKEEQIRMIEGVLDVLDEDKKSGTSTIEKMIQLYLDGDLDAIMKFETTMGREPTESDKRFMKMLLDDRNVHMADRLAARMEKAPGKTWFVAVGAAHHHGKIGVPALLEKKGFKVRRLTRTHMLPPKVMPEVKKPKKEPAAEPAGAK